MSDDKDRIHFTESDQDSFFADESLTSLESGDIPDRLRSEDNLSQPKPEQPYGLSNYHPDTREKRIFFEMLQIDGMTVKMAARAADVSQTTFRKVFAREIHEAAKVRAQLNPGDDFSPMAWHRQQVVAYTAAGLKPEEICGIMFRGNVEMSRFNSWFGHELAMGSATIVGAAMNRMHRVILTGKDGDARLASAFVLKQKGLGDFRDTTRYDHNKHDKDAAQTTADQMAETEQAMVDELVASGTEREAAKALIKSLTNTGKGLSRQPAN